MHPASLDADPRAMLRLPRGVGRWAIFLALLAGGGCGQSAIEQASTPEAGSHQGPIELAGRSPWRVMAQAGGGLAPGAIQISWQGKPHTLARQGNVASVGSEALNGPEGRWLPPRGAGERQHLRFLGGRLHGDLGHWFRDVFRREDEVRVVDDFEMALARRGTISVQWWLVGADDFQVTLADDSDGRWRLRWGNVELEIQGSRGCRAEFFREADGLVRVILTSPPDSLAFKLLQIFREAPGP